MTMNEWVSEWVGEWMSEWASEWQSEAEGVGWMCCLKNAKVKYKIQVHNQQKEQRDRQKERQTDGEMDKQANDESRSRPDNPIAIAIHFTIVHWLTWLCPGLWAGLLNLNDWLWGTVIRE